MPQGPFESRRLFRSWEVRVFVQKPQVSLRRAAQDSDHFEGPKNILKNWLASLYGREVAENNAADHSFTYHSNETHALEVEAGENSWAFRALHPGSDGRLHVTEASLARRTGRRRGDQTRVELHITQNAVLAAGETYAPPYFASFLPSLAAEYRLLDSGVPLTTHVQTMRNKTEAERTLALVDSEQRRQPVIVFVPPTTANAADVADYNQYVMPIVRYLAGAMGGLAHIVAVPRASDVPQTTEARRDMAEMLRVVAAREGVGRLEPGTFHVYGPGNPIGTFFTMQNAVGGRPGHWPGFQTHLQNGVAALSYQSPPSTSPFLRVRTTGAPDGQPLSEDDILNGLTRIEQVIQDAEASRAQGLNLGHEGADRMEGTIAELSEFRRLSKNPEFDTYFDEMERTAAGLRRVFRATAYGITTTYEQKYSAIADWVEKNYADRLVLPQTLINTLSNADPGKVYRDFELVIAGLQELATNYYASRITTGKVAALHRQRFQERLRELRLQDTRSLGNSPSRQDLEAHTVKIEDDYIFLARHLGRGPPRTDERAVLRIYYSWDEPRRRVVVGHLPTHLTTSMTARIT
jgi:hypothetical protein